MGLHEYSRFTGKFDVYLIHRPNYVQACSITDVQRKAIQPGNGNRRMSKTYPSCFFADQTNRPPQYVHCTDIWTRTRRIGIVGSGWHAVEAFFNFSSLVRLPFAFESLQALFLSARLAFAVSQYCE